MTYKVMVVDDEPDLELMMKQRFRKQIKSEELQFTFASNGNEALNKLNSNGDIDLILTVLIISRTGEVVCCLSFSSSFCSP